MNGPVQYDAEFRTIATAWRDIHHFRDALILFYCLPASRGIAYGRWTVTEVEMFETSGNGAHEYLVATLVDRSSHVISLHISGQILRPRGPKRLNVSWVDPSALVIDRSSIKDRLLHRITFPEDRIPLPRFVDLILAVHASHSEYHLLSKNGYWFAFVIGKTLKQIYPHQEEYFNRSDKRWTLDFNSSAMKRPLDFNIARVLEEYDTQDAAFFQQIFDVVNNAGNHNHHLVNVESDDDALN
ncbi:hypothetical protein AX17_007524 [Amanita inopinata Kibby_2008]|nr:hypothetical protein AX17_007524 [Amanita inopinata Kibby_2008]